MPDLVVLDLGLAQAAHRALVRIFENDEPVPAWEEGDRGVIEMCCNCTEVAAFGVQKYPDLPTKAAKLFYSTIKNHPFPNANKRYALVLTMTYLLVNDHRLTAQTGLGYRTATAVARSDPHTPEESPEAIVNLLADFFHEHIEPYNWRSSFD